MNYIYLAAPYSHADPLTRESRVRKTRRVAATFMLERIPTFVPTVMGHALDVEIHSAELPPDSAHEFWMTQCLPFVKSACALLVLELPGWSISRGIGQEIAHAEQCGIPIISLPYHPFTRSINEARAFVRHLDPLNPATTRVRPNENDGPYGVHPYPWSDAPDRPA